MITLSLVVRNLLRNRRRSLATLLAMTIGAASILMFGGYSTNIKYSMQTAYVGSGGHLQIQHRDFYLYGGGDPTKYGIVDHAKILDAIQRDAVLRDMVAVATPTLQFGGIAGNYDAGVSRTIIGNGVVAADVNRMRLWNDFDLPLATPIFALEGEAADTAIVGVGVARVLHLCEALNISDCPQPAKEEGELSGKLIPDDIAELGLLEIPTSGQAQSSQGRIELLASNARGTPNVTSVQVIRAESQGFKEVDEVLVVLHLAQAQRLIYGAQAPKVTSIILQLHHSNQMPAAKIRLAALLSRMFASQPLSVLDFETLNPFYGQTLGLFDTIFGFIFVLIAGIVLFTVGNTMNMAVVERTVEIGTLRAIGLRQASIRWLFVLEGLLLGLAGAVVGAICALIASFIANRLGLTWLPPGSVEALPLVLNVWGETRMIFGTVFGLIVIATLSAWWPAYRAAKMNVVDALRHV